MKPPYLLVPLGTLAGQVIANHLLSVPGIVALCPFATYAFIRTMRWAAKREADWQWAEWKKEYDEKGTVNGISPLRPFAQPPKPTFLRLALPLFPIHALVMSAGAGAIVLTHAQGSLLFTLMLLTGIALLGVQFVGEGVLKRS